MSSSDFIKCYNNVPIILTEGAVGLRMTNEFHILCDNHISHAGHIYNAEGRKAWTKIYSEYLQIAQDFSLPIILMTNTRRCNKERIANSNFSDKNILKDHADFLRELISKFSCEAYIGGCVGCKGDGYTGDGCLTKDEAEDFHSWQIEAIAKTDVDFIYSSLMPTLDETIGMANLIEKTDLPYIISFMIRENGTIIDGTSIHSAIDTVDNSVAKKPLCYMANCVHPKIVKHALRVNDTDLVRERFKGIQANAAYLNPEELDKPSETISSGAKELADEITSLTAEFPLKIYGGCCGTDGTHLGEFARRLTL